MKSDLKTRHGGRILADALAAQGVRVAFGVPGESYLPVLDGLHDLREQIHFIVCRQEGGASYMAEAYGKLTGEPGVLFVTRGPGATNGAIGVHTGFQDSTPMVVFIGQVPNEFAEREAFQEIDYRRMYGQMAKWVAQIDRVERIPEYVSHAFHTAMAGRPGPVVLALPEDTLFSQAAVADVPRYHTVRPSPSPAEVSSLRELLLRAQRPFVLIGGGGWNRDACLKLQRWVERAGLPAGTSFRCQDLFDNRSPSYAGDVGIGINPKLAQRIKDADVLLVIGARLGEMTTGGYTLLEAPVPQQALIHVHAGGAGNFAGWLHRHFRYKGFRTQLGPTNGSMGYGFPAALAAKLAAPERTVVAVCGDGDFLMNGQELATAVQYGANFIALVVNNGLYGTIRMHQEREYPGRIFGTDLRNPDFAAYARAFGAHGETVERTEDFAPAFERASKSGKPAIIELRIDPDAITPATTLSAIREKALKSKQ